MNKKPYNLRALPQTDKPMRDYFAAHVAQGMAAFSGTAGISYGPHEIAGRSYQIADAMLEHREKPDAE